MTCGSEAGAGGCPATPHTPLPRDEDQWQHVHQEQREEEHKHGEQQRAADATFPRVLGRLPLCPRIAGQGRPVLPVRL